MACSCGSGVCFASGVLALEPWVGQPQVYLQRFQRPALAEAVQIRAQVAFNGIYDALVSMVLKTNKPLDQFTVHS